MEDNAEGRLDKVCAIDGGAPTVEPEPLLPRSDLHTKRAERELAGLAGAGAGCGGPTETGVEESEQRLSDPVHIIGPLRLGYLPQSNREVGGKVVDS